MQITLDIDDDLLRRAANLVGVLDPSLLVREGIKALVERESSKRLARLGGTQRKLRAPPRRRPKRA